MKRIWSVAHNTFIEAIRDRVLFSLILFAFVMILSSLIFASISAEQYNKIVKDLGLTAISLIGIMISIFLGMGLVYKEIEKKTVYNIFSKPIRRYEFIVGKYLGLSFTLLVNTAAMAFLLFLFAIGRFSSDIRLLAEQVKQPVVGIITEITYMLIPTREKFDVRREAVY